jgi:hypothetical protein
VINTDEISISLNSAETVAIMHAIVLRMEQIPEPNEEFIALYAIVEKLGPHIERKLRQTSRLMRDGLN